MGIATKRNASESIKKIFKIAENNMYKNKISDSESAHKALIDSFEKNLRTTCNRSKELIDKLKDYAIKMGKKINLSKIEIEELRLLINLHNIGKLALADEIMSKPGRLSKGNGK